MYLKLESVDQFLRAFHFLVSKERVAGGVQPVGKEEASFLGFGVRGERGCTFVLQAALVLVRLVVGFFFTFVKEAPILGTLGTPAHLCGASVEDTETATRNHHVKLAASHVVADIVGHNDQVLAHERLVEACRCILAFTGKLEVKAFATVTFSTRSCREGEGQLVVNDDRELVSADTGVAAVAHACCALVGNLVSPGVAGFGLAAVFGPCTVGLAAVPVAGGIAGAALAAAHVLDLVAGIDAALAARGLHAGAGLCRRARRLGLLLLLAAGRLRAGAGLRLLRGAACRCCAGDILAVFAIGIMVAVQFAGIVIGVLFALGTSLFCVVIDALARNAVEAFSVAVARYGGRGFRLLLFGGGTDNHDRGGAAQDDRRREAAGRNRGNRCAGEHGNCRAGCRRQGSGRRSRNRGSDLFKSHDREICRVDFKNGGAI